MLQLDVGAIKKAPGDFGPFNLSAELPPFELRGEYLGFLGPVKASLIVSNVDSALVVEGEVSGGLKLNCGRCLEPYDYFFHVPFKETYAQAAQDSEGEVVTFSGDILDIAPEVLNSIILSLPMKALCSEDCRGLCPRCGCNLNESRCDCSDDETDPRLSVLKKLLKGTNQ
ncbi:DUF177 domain-containing protein [Pelotomaculum terephthalicicum JT]|uniref:YceD family protein n=1 Tax=Pelotomaculum TaxID=191373 RepID=UPI0009C9178B|nr:MULTISPECIES: DUF177 domain-containing protein [Pelotomaculum]MCG9969775.1 DUF177 domain-containing protein [Pelotomaculum terephthalicicum JT]OPX84791.1 MAG: hypothetical protein A4E54_02784 [Pelotomaculum sp. PtaB.Bin117]OPY62158.1 MAG: hypothetical protein A4E56_01503 [Pelotomaculum sp. PtaU1.Bin065]